MSKDRKLTQKELKKLHDLNSIDATKAMVNDLWKKACSYDEIDPKALFANFTQDNPFTNGLNIAVGNLMILKAGNTHRLV